MSSRIVLQSSVGGRLGWSHAWTTVDSTAINTDLETSPLSVDLESLGCVPRSGRAGHRDILFLARQEASTLISMADAPFYSPPAVNKSSSFPTSWPALLVICLPNDSHSDWSQMKSQSSFDLHVSGSRGWRASFHIFIGYFLLFPPRPPVSETNTSIISLILEVLKTN